MKLSEKIVTLRKARGMSQEELAEKLEVSRQAVSRWEVGSALPDASNVLQLSKLFGVTTDYLLNEEYESDRDVPIVKTTEKAASIRIQRLIGFCVAWIGLMGNFVIYIISRMVKVAVPVVTYDDTGKRWYTWNSEIKDYSYKYFVKEHNLELLTVMFWIMVVVGVLVIVVKRERVKKMVLDVRQRVGKWRERKNR